MERTLSSRVDPSFDGMRLRDYLKKELCLTAVQVSRAKFRPQGICVNGEQVTVRHVLHEDDLVEVRIEEEEDGSNHLLPTWDPVDVVYEDEDILIVNKPAGVVVHPSHGHYADSMANRITGYYARQELHVVIRPIGRLDKDTSGLLCFAKNSPAASMLERDRQNGILHRYYLAVCEGIFEESEGIVEQPIGDVDGELMKQEVRPDGAPAKTAYKVLKTENGRSLVFLKLYTGRTHQIRVHMAYLGHPLVGDPLYNPVYAAGGGAEGFSEQNRAMLHSCRLEGRLPFSREAFSVVCPPPEDFTNLMPADYAGILADLR